jgi:probable phosphoglycerate mutase
MKEYLFIRHGQTDWNTLQKVMGRQPIPLNDKGRREARGVADLLKDIDLAAVATSPVERALETAEIIMENRPATQLIVEEGLSEIEYGEWVNLKIADIVARYPDVWQNYHGNPEAMKIPGGEEISKVQERAVGAVRKLREKFPDGRLAFISHADVIKLAVIGILNWPLTFFKSFSMENGAVILLREHPALGMRMIWFNHLNGVGRDIRDGQ